MKLSSKLALGLCVLTSTASTIIVAEDQKQEKLTPQEEAVILETLYLTDNWATNPKFSEKFKKAFQICSERDKLHRNMELIKSRAVHSPDGKLIVLDEVDSYALQLTIKKYDQACTQCEEKIAELKNMQPTASN